MKTDKKVFSRRLDDGSPFVIWEKAKKGNFKRGMILDTLACDNPECRLLHIRAFAIDERFKKMSFKGDRFLFSVEPESEESAAPIPNQRVTATLDIDSSEISLSDSTPPEKQDLELFSWVTKEVKGDQLEVMKRRSRALKKVDRDQWRNMDWSWWEEGVTVGWYEVFPDDLDFLFSLWGNTHWVKDWYCINPACPCRDVTFSFTKIVDEKEYEELGAVVIDLKRFRINDTQAIGASSEELTQLWRIFQKEREVKKITRTRQKEMKTIGKEIAALSFKHGSQGFKTTSSVGRNDPCPCGSGKKYKRCCLK